MGVRYHPWEAAPNLSYYAHRYQLEWKDQVYCDISFSRLSSQARLIRAEMVNNTTEPQSLVLHYMAYLNFPAVRAYSTEPIELCEAKLPEGAIWLDALDYQKLEFAIPRPTDNLGYDGFYRAEQRGQGFVNGSGLGQGFGKDKDDRVNYTLKLNHPLEQAALLIRYRLAPSQEVSFRLNGPGLEQRVITLNGRGSFDLAQFEIGKLAAGEYNLELVSLGYGRLNWMGLSWRKLRPWHRLALNSKEWKPTPQIIAGPVTNSFLMKYEHFRLLWPGLGLQLF